MNNLPEVDALLQKGATKAGIIYPSLDASCFEIKYLNTDIIGKVVSL